jgi:quercetin dioxygenase-like cupin family protein
MSISDATSAEHRRLRVLGEVVEVKLSAADTAGAYALFEVHSPPGSGVPALHTHPSQETFYVLEGEYELYAAGPDGPQAVQATPGSVAHVPAGAPHGYKNVGETPGRVLAIFEPPGRMQELFEAVDAEQPGADRLGDLFEQHDVVVLP